MKKLLILGVVILEIIYIFYLFGHKNTLSKPPTSSIDDWYLNSHYIDQSPVLIGCSIFSMQTLTHFNSDADYQMAKIQADKELKKLQAEIPACIAEEKRNEKEFCESNNPKDYNWFLTCKSLEDENNLK